MQTTNSREIAGYTVVDGMTGAVLKSYTVAQRKAAYRYAEKRCQQYGSYRYTVQLVWA